MRRLRHAMLVPALLLAACGAAPTTQPPTNLGIANGTTVTVTLFVNGVSFGDMAPGAVEPTVAGSALPPLPWRVEARSPTGEILATMLTGPYGDNTTFSAFFDDLACGQITLWTGPTEPTAPAGESPGPSLIPCGP